MTDFTAAAAAVATDGNSTNSFDLKKIVRPNILELTPYRCARDDYSDGILLDANENSLGASVSSHAHLQLHRYPDPLHYNIKQLISELRGGSEVVTKEQIFLGVGSDEAIDILFRIFCQPTVDNCVITPPTYGMYKVCAKINDVAVKAAPLTAAFDLDAAATLAAVDARTKLLFICSPGNPTSKIIPNAEVEKLCKALTSTIVVVDEAYIDFSSSSDSSAVSLINRYPNVVVLQTLSKAFGLAGIRLGMALGNAAIIQLMNNVKAPYNVNKLTAEVAMEALSDLSTYRSSVARILSERDFLLRGLQSLTAVKKIHSSEANFLLFQVPRAQQIYKIMADAGVVCRYRGMEMHCTDCLRVTVGTRAENEQFLRLLQSTAADLGVA